jgi:ion channel-forming bestrophin family protein
MVTYNPKEWFRLIFHFHKSDTFRQLLPTMFVLGLLTGLVVYLEGRYLDLKVPSLTLFHQIAGFVISLVLVFRINTAYDRWWEGRRLWGSLVNSSRSLAIKLHALLPSNDRVARKECADLIVNFAFSLKEHLRGNAGEKQVAFSPVLTDEKYLAAVHRPNYVARELTRYVLGVCKTNPQTGNDYLILSEQLSQLTDVCGACERIKNTPIPYAYSIFIKKIIFLYIITMPVDFGMSMGYWAIPVVMIMFYAFASLELISEEIEDPFGTDANDLPTDDLSEKIRNNVNEILLSDAA